MLLIESEVEQGTVPDGETIAVKKLAENSPLPRDKAFNNEVQNIMALQHEKVAKLVGYCHESQKKVVQNNGRYIVADIVESVLCYEYLPGGSLKKNLFGMSYYPIQIASMFRILIPYRTLLIGLWPSIFVTPCSGLNAIQ